MADSVIGTGTVQSCALQCTGGQYAAKRALQATPRLTHMHGTAKVYDEIADTRDQLDPRLQRLNRQRTGEKLEVPQQPAFFPYPSPLSRRRHVPLLLPDNTSCCLHAQLIFALLLFASPPPQSSARLPAAPQLSHHWRNPPVPHLPPMLLPNLYSRRTLPAPRHSTLCCICTCFADPPPPFLIPWPYLQSKYISQLMREAKKRNLQEDLRKERAAQKEREREGEEFADKVRRSTLCI